MKKYPSRGPGEAALRRPDQSERVSALHHGRGSRAALPDGRHDHLEREDIQLAGWSAARGLVPDPAFGGSG